MAKFSLVATMILSDGLHSSYATTLSFSLEVGSPNGQLGINWLSFSITLAKALTAIILARLVNVGWALAPFIFILAVSLPL